jgi:hypothetical protein
LPNIQGGEATIIEGNLQELIRNKKEAAIIDVDSEDEEDEKVLQYCSDDANDNNDDMSPDDEDEDF